MIRGLFRLAATLLTLTACSFFIAAFATVGFATFLLTWPLVWGSPTRRRVGAGVDLIGSIMRLVTTFDAPVSSKYAAQMARAAVDAIPEDAPPPRNPPKSA